jgi:hypothetical protein
MVIREIMGASVVTECALGNAALAAMHTSVTVWNYACRWRVGRRWGFNTLTPGCTLDGRGEAMHKSYAEILKPTLITGTRTAAISP